MNRGLYILLLATSMLVSVTAQETNDQDFSTNGANFLYSFHIFILLLFYTIYLFFFLLLYLLLLC